MKCSDKAEPLWFGDQYAHMSLMVVAKEDLPVVLKTTFLITAYAQPHTHCDLSPQCPRPAPLYITRKTSKNASMKFLASSARCSFMVPWEHCMLTT